MVAKYHRPPPVSPRVLVGVGRLFVSDSWLSSEKCFYGKIDHFFPGDFYFICHVAIMNL